MITLECSKCNKTRSLDETDDDEVQNAFIEGWEFSLVFDSETFCPSCDLVKSLKEPDEL